MPAPRRPARQRAQKQPKYAELPSDSDEEDDDDGWALGRQREIVLCLAMIALTSCVIIDGQFDVYM